MATLKKSPKQESFNELCRFAEEYGLSVELDKPFVEFENIILNVVRKSDEKIVEQVILEDITSLDRKSAHILNDLSRKHNIC